MEPSVLLWIDYASESVCARQESWVDPLRVLRTVSFHTSNATAVLESLSLQLPWSSKCSAWLGLRTGPEDIKGLYGDLVPTLLLRTVVIISPM